MPLAIGAAVVLVITTWLRGSDIVGAKARNANAFRWPTSSPPWRGVPRHRSRASAVYLTPDPDLTPSALLHNLKHNGVLHETNAIVAVRTADRPRVSRTTSGPPSRSWTPRSSG